MLYCTSVDFGEIFKILYCRRMDFKVSAGRMCAEERWTLDFGTGGGQIDFVDRFFGVWKKIYFGDLVNILQRWIL